MENTTTDPNNIIEVLTELTISDIKTLDFIVTSCLNINMFADTSTPIVQQLSEKLNALIQKLETE